jgi:hypothetical protein
MSDHDAELRRYAALSDRLALDEQLAPDEHAFLERMQQRNEECRLEAELMDSLGDLDGPPTEATRALVEAALAGVGGHAPPTELSARRKERRMAAGRSRRWLMLGGSLAVAAAALLLIQRGRDAKRGGDVDARIELVYLAGQISIGGKPVSSSSQLLHEGDVLTVERGSACIAMDPEIDVCASSGTRLQLTSTRAAARRLDLLQGKVAVQLAPQPEGHKLSIVSEGVWSTAIGTAFTVQRDENRGVHTTVLNGKVRVGESDAQSKLVSAHQRARVMRHSPAGARQPEVAAISRNDESPEWAMLGPAKLWNAAVAATLEISGAPAGAYVTLDGQSIGIAPLSTLVPVGTRRVEVRVGSEVMWSRQVALAAGERQKISLEGVANSAKAVAPVEAPALEEHPTASARARSTPLVRAKATVAKRTTSSSAELLRDAHKLLREGERDAAASKYAELMREHPASAEARSSLLSLAELELEHLGDAAAALQLADRYLARGPGGTLAPEARETRVRALRSLGRRSEERAAIEEYLKAYPNSLRARALEKRLAELGGSPQRERESKAPGSATP